MFTFTRSVSYSDCDSAADLDPRSLSFSVCVRFIFFVASVSTRQRQCIFSLSIFISICTAMFISRFAWYPIRRNVANKTLKISQLIIPKHCEFRRMTPMHCASTACALVV